MLRVVFDTNVIISGLLKPVGPPGKLLGLAVDGAFELFVWDELENEVRDKLQQSRSLRKYIAGLGMDADAILNEALRDVLAAYPKVEPAPLPPDTVKTDKRDVHVVGAGVACRADYIVTGDIHDLLSLGQYEEIKFVSPAQFLRVLSR